MITMAEVVEVEVMEGMEAGTVVMDFTKNSSIPSYSGNVSHVSASVSNA